MSKSIRKKRKQLSSRATATTITASDTKTNPNPNPPKKGTITPGPYWLFKSEPDEFSYDDLVASPLSTDQWNGVRNHQAKNYLRDHITQGTKGLFYHSSCKEPGVVGTVEIVKSGYPDHTAWDRKSEYFDKKSDPDNPTWYMVDVKAIKKLPRIVILKELKNARAAGHPDLQVVIHQGLSGLLGLFRTDEQVPIAVFIHLC